MKLQHQAEGYLELGMPQQALDALARVGQPETADVQTLYLQGEALRALGATARPSCRWAASPNRIRRTSTPGWPRAGATNGPDGSIWPSTPWRPPSSPTRRSRSSATTWPAIWSLAGGKRQALTYLEQALSLDPNYRGLVDHEPDFDPIRSDREFQALCEGTHTADDTG